MVYDISAAFVFVCFIALDVLRNKFPLHRKAIFIVNTALSSAGVIMTALFFILTRVYVSSLDEETAGWVNDNIGIFVKISYIALALVVGIIFLSSLSEIYGKTRGSGYPSSARRLTSLFASAMLLIFGGFFSQICYTPLAPISECISLAAFSEAFILRGTYLTEYAAAKKRSDVTKT